MCFVQVLEMESNLLFVRSKENKPMENKLFSCVASMEKETCHFSKEFTMYCNGNME